MRFGANPNRRPRLTSGTGPKPIERAARASRGFCPTVGVAILPGAMPSTTAAQDPGTRQGARNYYP
jgi:hypothetical protein